MSFNDPIWHETVRLTRKFFPESRGYIYAPADFNLDTIYKMLLGVSPNLKRHLYDVNLEDFDLYNWVMETASFSPCGRAVLVPECVHPKRLPFVCDASRVAERINEGHPALRPNGSSNNSAVFNCGADTFIVFESGEAFLVDHHEGVCWARSGINA